MPAALAALAGEPVHVITFNDYLARRDAAWMGPVYGALGLRAAHVNAGMGEEDRRAAYGADVTCLTAQQAGFDYLRDGLCMTPEARVQRGCGLAIVDEADSILIDEARIPLVIAGSQDAQPNDARRMAALARSLQDGVDYRADDARRNVYLTDAGQEGAEQALGIDSLHTEEHGALLAQLNHALQARALLRRDVDYIVRDGVVELVDEFTGRVVPDRHWPDGLQAALEAREGLRFGREGALLGSMTLQHYFRLYDRLTGMTATARPEQEELDAFYGLQVLVLPQNRPCIRRDLPDRIYANGDARLAALLHHIEAQHERGRPVLVGTASVAASEALADALRQRGLSCEVLNARTDELEAALVAEAGAPGAITISTNMAGRGTDIRLGGSDEASRSDVLAAGGLCVLGTNRHESRRIDRQLRGRAGRQGDPGTSQFFVSLDDDLVVRHGLDAVLPANRREGGDGELNHPLVAERIDWAQRVIEGQNLDIRRTLWEYSSYVEQQRLAWRQRRDRALDEAAPTAWRTLATESWQAMVAALGEPATGTLERRATLSALDGLWADHLQTLAHLRDGIHFVRIARGDPLFEFVRQANVAWKAIPTALDERLAQTATSLAQRVQSGADLAALHEQQEVRGPSATWTYLVDDNPFQDALGLHVSGDIGLSIGAALFSPLFMAASLWRRMRGT